jgi:predicted phage terminase large subunit-like protein
MTLKLSNHEYHAVLREDLMSFIYASFVELNPETRFSCTPHIEVLASKLAACARGEIRRLIINLPPRSLKSHSTSIALVAWLLGREPSAEIICASYGQDLADKHARDCRTLMMSPFYANVFPQTKLSREKQSVGEFVTTKQGFRMSTSVGGVLTGRGGNFLIIDDPLKPDEALSESRRKSVNDWYDNTLTSRLNNKNTGCIILVMQRLHQDDLAGHVMAQGGWEVVSFPAIAEQDEEHLIDSPLGSKIYRREKGDVLDETRETLETLQSIRESTGTYNFLSQYQQNPMPAEGNMVKTEWLSYYELEELPKEFCRIIQSWDTANKPGELNDFSVCTTWGEFNNRYYLLDVWRARVDYPGLKRAVRRQAELHNPNIISIEDKASGTQLIQELRSEGLYNLKPFEPAGTDKTMRLYTLTAIFEGRRVLLPKSAPWLVEYVRELTSFPGCKFDDQVDSTSQALEYLKNRRITIYDVL